MKIAFVCSNYFNIRRETQNGTAIFDHSLLSQFSNDKRVSITAFASGASEVPVPLESIDHEPSSADSGIIKTGKNVLYEQTLLSKAFSMQDRFDVFHVNIGDGDIALPFAPFVKKPILITIHHLLDTDYMRKYFMLHRDRKNVFFVSVSDAQRAVLPGLNYLRTIYHGVDPELFAFDPVGGSSVMWAGRIIPEKGLDHVVAVAKDMKLEARLFGIPRKKHAAWLKRVFTDVVGRRDRLTLESGFDRYQLIPEYQRSKVFLLPVLYEESFGLVFIEAMSCGTPVIAFAKGSVPEVIKDGETGFIVNSSDKDIRGDWIVKKTGSEGLREALDRIYKMPAKEYGAMRQACRAHVLQNFTLERMAKEYRAAYSDVIRMHKAS